MHEANAVRIAIQKALTERDAVMETAPGRPTGAATTGASDVRATTTGATGDPAATITGATGDLEITVGAYRHLELEIIDPTRATAEVVQLYAPPILDELGLRDVSFDIFVRAIRCSLCRRMTHAEPFDPVCRCCGAPLPRTEGAAIEAHWTKPVPVPAGAEPVRDVGSHLADHHRAHVQRVHR